MCDECKPSPPGDCTAIIPDQTSPELNYICHYDLLQVINSNSKTLEAISKLLFDIQETLQRIEKGLPKCTCDPMVGAPRARGCPVHGDGSYF